MNNSELLAEIVKQLIGLTILGCVYGYVISLAFPLTFFQGSVIGFMFCVLVNKIK